MWPCGFRGHAVEHGHRRETFLQSFVYPNTMELFCEDNESFLDLEKKQTAKPKK
jgi:hypothetical protein